MRKSIYPLVLISSIAIFGCSTIMNNIPGVYTLDIQQGNIISQEVINQLRPQMTKRQVLYVMGSSMLVDIFHQERWDYLYSEQLGGGEREQKRVSLFFEDEKLISVQGDYKLGAPITNKRDKETTVDVPPRDLEKTLWEKIVSIF